MKIIILLTFLLSFSFGAAAMVKKANIDGVLSQKYDENYQETQRSLAGQQEKPQAETGDTADKDSESEEADRIPSSKGKSFEELNNNGVRYWKY
ncbi:MAG: hypothetical protein WD025_04120 [Bacteriovoracaceae bacterium]